MERKKERERERLKKKDTGRERGRKIQREKAKIVHILPVHTILSSVI